MHQFKACIEIIGINPFVFVPEPILKHLFEHARKDKGKIPIRGTINNLPYKQTLIKYSGAWRLYINTSMLKHSPKRIGENISITVELDPSDRKIAMHPKFLKALGENIEAKITFDNLRPSLQHEILRYLSFLKTEISLDKNIIKAINFLLGKQRFIGRDKP